MTAWTTGQFLATSICNNPSTSMLSITIDGSLIGARTRADTVQRRHARRESPAIMLLPNRSSAACIMRYLILRPEFLRPIGEFADDNDEPVA